VIFAKKPVAALSGCDVPASSVLLKLFFSVSPQSAANFRLSGKEQISGFSRQLPSPRSNKQKGQSTRSMNTSDYSCGAIKLNNGPNARIKTGRFSWLGFGLRIV